MLYRTWFDAMSVRERWERASSRSRTAKLLTPIFRIRPARWRASRAFIVSRSGTWLQGSGQCTWYKSIARTPRRFRLAAHAFFTSSARRCQPPTFVATKTRSRPTFRIARDMTRSEWPSPYASAVSTRLIPSSTARSIASRQSASRTSEPHAFPPACHIPSPTAETSGPPRPNDTYSIRPPRGRRVSEPKTYRGTRSNHSGGWSGRRKRRNDLLYLSWSRSDSEIPFRYAFSNADQSFDSIAEAIDPNASRTNAAISSTYLGRATAAVFRIFSDSFSMYFASSQFLAFAA